MISGILAISIAFVAAAVSTTAYWLYYRDQNERFFNLANRSFSIMAAALIFSAVLLYYNIFTHNFQLNYVYSYTSKQLSTYYLISTFWAGQEGTFLLWLLYGIVYGVILIRTIARKQPLVMFFVMLVQLFILLILLKKSPFAMIWHTHAEVPVGFMPGDGASLNPLLQNPWMIIHPPIMFIGYSSTVVAFALAANAMVIRNFSDWIKAARPWVIFSTLMLGAGIILGGYWSYVTLGWGGYWAWDPVENASLVPWLFSAVLLHGLIIQARQKGLVKTNLILAGLTFVSVLWGSFLTRSGVLGDFSVHSFAESDLNIYLVSFVALFSGIFLYLFIQSMGETTGVKFAEGLFSRETFILIGMLSILFTGIVVFVATSSPIYTGLLGKPSNVSINFYNTISIPIAIFILFSMALAPILAWKVSALREKSTVLLSAVSSAIITIVCAFLGLNQPVSILLVFLSVFVILLNGYVLLNRIKKHPVSSGAYFAHIGIGLMIIGIITSSLYDRSEKIDLPVGEFTPTRFGYQVQFTGFEKGRDGKDRAKLKVKIGDREYQADPQFYYSEYTKSWMVSPHVNVGVKKDIYIAPISFTPSKFANNQRIQLKKNESRQVDDIQIRFNKFDVTNHSESSVMMVRADLTVSVPASDELKEVRVLPAMWMENRELHSNEVMVPDTDYRVQIEELDANNGSVSLVVYSPGKSGAVSRDTLSVELSEKPFISLLWLGTLLLLGGVGVALVDRVKSLRV
ncbi:MAG: cytochrome c biogenesis protein CcsA [Calditrichia bacterium]